MKIGILTLPLRSNYGGNLQAYALWRVLTDLGHDVVLIRRDYGEPEYSVSLKLIRIIFKKFLAICGYNPWRKKQKYYSISSSLHTKFIEDNIKLTPRFNTSSLMTKWLSKNPQDVIIVGSDQVWRYIISPNIYNYFLSFVDGNTKKIAYAASFGTDSWEMGEKRTKECSHLAKCFTKISVRESSGVDLCRRYLGVSAIQLVDPTMLLSKDHYLNICKKYNEFKSGGQLFYYFLDENDKKKELLSIGVKSLNNVAFTCMPERQYLDKYFANKPDDYVYPPISKWLQSFVDAEFVLTDSFHGCVFSILFNKPFYVVLNKERGLARFDTLLSIFRLKERIIDPDNFNNIDWLKSVDWDFVNHELDRQRERSLEFLSNI